MASFCSPGIVYNKLNQNDKKELENLLIKYGARAQGMKNVEMEGLFGIHARLGFD